MRHALRHRVFTLFLAGLEAATFRVLSGCDNHYTTETTLLQFGLTEHRLSLAPEMRRLNFVMFDVKTTVGVKTGPRRCILTCCPFPTTLG